MYKTNAEGSVKPSCSPACSKKFGQSKKKKMYAMLGGTSGAKTNIFNDLKKDGFYSAQKEEYRNKIIDYSDSPTGKAYIGINKSPFMPAAENGYGYQGLLIQDENRKLVQCHGCGKWHRIITNSHTKSCLGITVQDYKKKYGLFAEKGLVSDETSLKLTKAALKNKQLIKDKQFIAKSVSVPNKTGHKHPMEFFNRHGTCPLQLKERLYDFIRTNRELPAQGNKGSKIYKALKRRYGSWGHALQSHGLPYFKRTGTTYLYVFADGTKYKFNINQHYNREELYHLLMKKCQVLQIDVLKNTLAK